MNQRSIHVVIASSAQGLAQGCATVLKIHVTNHEKSHEPSVSTLKSLETRERPHQTRRSKQAFYTPSCSIQPRGLQITKSRLFGPLHILICAYNTRAIAQHTHLALPQAHILNRTGAEPHPLPTVNHAYTHYLTLHCKRHILAPRYPSHSFHKRVHPSL